MSTTRKKTQKIMWR